MWARKQRPSSPLQHHSSPQGAFQDHLPWTSESSIPKPEWSLSLPTLLRCLQVSVLLGLLNSVPCAERESVAVLCLDLPRASFFPQAICVTCRFTSSSASFLDHAYHFEWQAAPNCPGSFPNRENCRAMSLPVACELAPSSAYQAPFLHAGGAQVGAMVAAITMPSHHFEMKISWSTCEKKRNPQAKTSVWYELFPAKHSGAIYPSEPTTSAIHDPSDNSPANPKSARTTVRQHS